MDEMTGVAIHLALAKKCGFDVKSSSTRPGQLRVIGSVHANNTKRWLAVMDKLLRASDKSAWEVDISKHYFLRGDVIRYGWRIIVQAENVEEHISSVAQVIRAAPSPKVSVEEYTLHGGGSNRNAVKNGKGASLLGQARIGVNYSENG